MKIAIICTEYLKDYISHAVQDLNLDREASIEIFIYYNYTHIVDIYHKIENQFDGFITSGPGPTHALEKSVANCKPVRYFDCSECSYYKTFFEVIYKYQDWNFEHGYFDFCDYLCPGQESSLVQRLKDGTFKEWLEENSRHMSQMSPEALLKSTGDKLQRHIELWNSGKIKYSLSRMSHIMPQILDAGVDCHYISFSYEDIQLCFHKLVQDLLVSELKDSRPAAIEILLHTGEGDAPAFEHAIDILGKLLTAFNQKFVCEFIINETKYGFRISTNYKTVEKLTDHLTCCHLREYLEENSQLSFSLGYGLGQELLHAESNAIDAARESKMNGQKNSYLFCEDRTLIALFGKGEDFTIDGPVTPYMREIATRTGLSTLTVQKLISALRITGTKDVTTLELSRVLHITIRSVNRLLGTLVKYNLAKSLYVRQTNTRGRPSKVYQIELDID